MTNTHFECCVEPLRHTHEKHFSRYATTNSTISYGWPIVGTNVSEWVQIFQKNLFRREPILGWSKLNVTYIHIHLERFSLVLCCTGTRLSGTLPLPLPLPLSPSYCTAQARKSGIISSIFALFFFATLVGFLHLAIRLFFRVSTHCCVAVALVQSFIMYV